MVSFDRSKLHNSDTDNRRLNRTDNGSLYNHANEKHQYYEFGFLRLIKNEKGSVDFLIIFALLIFIVFISVDFFTLFANYQVAKHVSYYYLERVRIEGCLTISDEATMKAKYSSVNMTVDDITCVNGLNNARVTTGGMPVLKDPTSTDASKIDMKITIKPGIKPLLSAVLIGASPMGNSFRLRVGGTVLSEKV